MKLAVQNYTLFDRARDYVYSQYERLFPSPVEVRLIEILGGTTFTIGGIRHGNRPMTITLSRGKLLRSRRFRRAVLDGKGVLANDVRHAVILQGADYENKVVEMYERDERLEELGWQLIYVKVRDIWQNPKAVRENLKPLFS